jgi:hypothetical protein
MTIDRRVFVAGAALAIVTPALRILPPNVAAPESDVVEPLFLISGWSLQDDSSADDQVWLAVGHGWRTVWR